MSDEYTGIEEMDLGVQEDGEPVAVVTEAQPEPETTPKEPATAEAEKPAEEVKETPEETEEKKRLTGSARKKAENERLRVQNQELQDRLKRLEEKVDPKPAAPSDEPQLESFEDFASWKAALGEYHEKKAIQKAQAQTNEARIKEAVNKTVEEGRKKFEDFDDDFEAIKQAPIVSGIVAEALVESSVAPDLIHHFAENPDELSRISQLSPVKAAREIVALEASFTAPPKPKQTSQAPPPIRPVSGSTVPVADTRHGGIEEF